MIQIKEPLRTDQNGPSFLSTYVSTTIGSQIGGVGMSRSEILVALLLGSVILLLGPPRGFAQTMGADPIRVESNEVLVPVVITDKERQARLQKETPGLIKHAMAIKNLHVLEESVAAIAIPDLAVKEIHLFEDGVEQVIQNAPFGPSLYWNVRDDEGYHSEFMGRGEGKWSGPQWPADRIAEISLPHYLIAYAPPPSAEGSCHQINVRVDRPNAIVNARSGYCNIKHPHSDPLFGTVLGKQSEDYLASVRLDDIDLALFAAAFYTSTDSTHVHIAIDTSWHLSRSDLKTKGVLGMIYKKDGSLATRFSDIYEWEGAPQRYETQIDIPAGDYLVKVVLSDGSSFGQAQTLLTVDNNNAKELRLSTIAFCRQIQEAPAWQDFRRKLALSSTSQPPEKYVPLISEGIEYKPTRNTRFNGQESLHVYFEVFEPLLNERSPVQVTFSIKVVDNNTGEVRFDSPSLNTTSYQEAGNSVIRVGQEIETNKLPNGSYEIEIQATDSTGRSTAWRKASFTIERPRRIKPS